jgi:four helix bundle protein
MPISDNRSIQHDFRLPNSSFILLPFRHRATSTARFAATIVEAKTMKPDYDLRVRTRTFALRIVRMFARLPKSTVAQVLGKQVLRSGTSVGANYCEAYRGRSKAEFIAKCGDSLRELEETNYWLELLVEGKVLPEAKLALLRQECHELIAIFITIVKRARGE